MKFATPFALVLALFLPSCATHDGTTTTPRSTSDDNADVPQQSYPSSPGGSAMGVYRGAREAAGAVNTARTLGNLF